MKIDRVILVVDTNPTYTIYWNIVSQVWLKKFNIKPTLLFYGTEEEFKQNNFIVDNLDYKILNPIPDISNPNPNWVVTWALFWGATQYPDDVCMLSGIDQIPISTFFFEEISEYNDNHFVVGFSDAYKNYTKDTLGYFNTQNGVMYPSSHLVGKGKMFKKIFEIDEIYENEMRKVFDSKHRYHLNNKFYGDSKLWGLDECYASEKIASYPNQSEIKHLEIFWDYWHPRRIDLNGNINSDFNVDLLKEGYYSELTCKGYETYREKINLVLDNLKEI
jgi:hypothetical protein